MLLAEPIFMSNPLAPSCHASTIVEASPGTFLAAWFAGTYEGHPDVAIWLARYEDGAWGNPIRVADEPNVSHYNPLLFRDTTGTLWLFYKIGVSVPTWTGMYRKSLDGGASWSEPVMLPAGLIGPAKNKPITLSNGDILCGTSNETWRSWACWVERSSDGGKSWTRHGPIVAPGAGAYEAGSARLVSAVWDEAAGTLLVPQDFSGVIQPTLWEYAPGRVKMLMRSTQRVGCVCASLSDDSGRTWSPAERLPIPNPNSGLDAVRLRDGRIVLACNPVPEGRTPLSVLVSEDNGVTWPRRKDLETDAGEYSYPSVIQAEDGRVHVVATHRRERIFHYVLEPAEL
ncbi:MAG: exo-alpha-sialidase [candidate division NC10 bacterium]|nr:exo-alpha-sialidase [candidate division NC10 bacterium]